VRSVGIALALDDFGDGRSSLRLWSQLKPEIVKIDKYFTKNISENGDKLKTIQALQQIAAVFGSELVAEGIETAEDLRVLRDLGITYGQGYFLGHPDRQPAHYLNVRPKAASCATWHWCQRLPCMRCRPTTSWRAFLWRTPTCMPWHWWRGIAR
jgi:EAL domain-containing protein (putative c-di-GMP-specific phosphodiesterase class I)